MKTMKDALRVADKVLLALQCAPVTVGDLRLEVGGSVGVACGPQDGADIEALLLTAESDTPRLREIPYNYTSFSDQPIEHRNQAQLVLL